MTPRQIEKRIAGTLRGAASQYPEVCALHDPPAVFRFGSLTIRCRPARPAVEAVAAKYDRGASRTEGCTSTRPRKMYAGLRTVGPYDWRKV